MNTNNTFTLTMPTDDPIALNAFSRALHEMAVAHGVKRMVENNPDATVDDIDAYRQSVVDGLSRTVSVPTITPVVTDPVLTDDELVKAAHTLTDEEFDALTEPHNDLIDSEGLPWDERIHAGSKTRNQDGTWKARKKRQDMTAEEWSDYVTGVKAELKELMNVPVVTPPVPAPEPEVTQEDVDKLCQALVEDLKPELGEKYAHIAVYGEEPHVPVPPVVGTPVPPVPIVEPEVTVAPPVSDSVTTFPALMTWLTSHESVLTVERVNQVVQSHGLTELKQLIQRPDLIPQVF
ncbi:MAG: hypothetical protein ACRC8W_21135, partial [Plesiomonas shigelloides]